MKLLIVTPTLNEGHRIGTHLKNLKESLLALRNHVECECIFVDGGSTDTTIEKLEKSGYVYKIKPKSNIYEAFNVGLNYAFDTQFDYVMFLGVGDIFKSDALLSKLFELKMRLPTDCVIFSDFHWSNGKRVDATFTLANGLMGFPHAGTIFPLSFFNDNLFDDVFDIAGDLEWLMKSWPMLQKCLIIHSQHTFVVLEAGGISMSRSKKLTHLREFLQICLRYRQFPSLRFIISNLLR